MADRSPLRFAAVGQALMHHDLRDFQDPRFLSAVEMIRSSDVTFTNFEGAVVSPSDSPPPDSRPSDPAMLDVLKWMGLNLLSLANNHAFEAREEGVTHTKELARERGFAAAGTGSTLAEATDASFIEVSGVRIALIAMDTANCQTKDAVAGEGGKPGVNPLRGDCVDSEVKLREDDVSRNLHAIEVAAQQADLVLVSLHEHFWPKEWSKPLPWKGAFARQCIDGGATAFLCHGIPRACAIEAYKGRPIFHSLGNFIFHSVMTRWHKPEIWEGFIVTAELADSRMEEIRLLPTILVDADGRTDVPYETRWYPTRATGEVAERILDRVAAESAELGTTVKRIDGEGLVLLP